MDHTDGNIPQEDRRLLALSCNSGRDVLTCHELQIIEIVTLVFFANIVALFGVIGNFINIIIFFKQGFANAINISFFSMAISDLGCQTGLLWVCMCLNPFIYLTGVPWVPFDFSDLPGGWPHVAFGRITSYITVFITAERCLSIITPMKVKEIITPKRATVIIFLIYVINILVVVPEYATSYLEFKFFPETNTSLIAINFMGYRAVATAIIYFMGSFTGILSFVGVIVWTVILVIKLQQSSKWRQKASNDREGITSNRDKKTIKMVAIIASVLIVCYTPGTAAYMSTLIEPEIQHERRYMNVWVAIWAISYAFNSINSSVNIVLYYRMSTKYKQTFDELFHRNFTNEHVIISKKKQLKISNLQDYLRVNKERTVN